MHVFGVDQLFCATVRAIAQWSAMVSPQVLPYWQEQDSVRGKLDKKRQTGLATAAPRVHDTGTDAGRHAGAQGLDEKAADEQALDFFDFFKFFFFLNVRLATFTAAHFSDFFDVCRVFVCVFLECSHLFGWFFEQRKEKSCPFFQKKFWKGSVDFFLNF